MRKVLMDYKRSKLTIDHVKIVETYVQHWMIQKKLDIINKLHTCTVFIKPHNLKETHSRENRHAEEKSAMKTKIPKMQLETGVRNKLQKR